jgi:competence protein ComEA
MIKKLIVGIATLFMLVGVAFADVDVNKGDQAALDSVKGIGPAISKKIVDERQAHGPYKDWTDFEKRVKGIGDKKAATLSQAGLTVNGQSMPNAPASSAAANKQSATSPSASTSGAGNAGTRNQTTAKGGAGANNPFNQPTGTTAGKAGAPVTTPAKQ